MAKDNELECGVYVSLNYEDEKIVVNYALQQNGEKFGKSIVVLNKFKEPINDVIVRVTVDPDFAFTYETKLDLPADDGINIIPDILLKTGYLQGLTEKQIGVVNTEVIYDGHIIASEQKEVELLAYDEWAGSKFSPEMLASFVTPNHPRVSAVLSEASKVLREWNMEPDFEGYQAGDRNRVMNMMAAIYTALRRFKIIYNNPPASFEHAQRVRLPHKVLEERKGTCLDLSVLYAACLEAAGLNPLIVMIDGHAFAGCWLVDSDVDEFSNGYMDNHACMLEKIAHKDHRILLVNCVEFCLDKGNDFQTANKIGRNYIKDKEDFRYVLDITALRKTRGIRPMAINIASSLDDDYFDVQGDVKITEKAPQDMDVSVIESNEPKDKKAFAKQRYWEKKLLDMSIANPLISLFTIRHANVKDDKGNNVKIVQRVTSALELAFRDIGTLEDKLADGLSFTIRSDFGRYTQLPIKEQEIRIAFSNALGNMGVDESNKEEFMAAQEKSFNIAINQFLKTSFAREQIFLTDGIADADKKLKNLVKVAKRSVEENGANTLYLVLGELRWFAEDLPYREFKTEDEEREYIINYIRNEAQYAPLILVPVDVVRNSFDNSYTMRSRQEETQINITLLEFLKQNFNIEISDLDPLPLDAHGVDVDLIMKKINMAIENKAFWEITDNTYLGHFSFAKFVMWNDIHNHAEEIAENKVINSLLHGGRMWTPQTENINEDNIEQMVGKLNMIVPSSADSSQLISVAKALSGESFVLQGPPGTGKSQTITNLIANALYNDKKVLFVAEKKAALDVVKKRLDEMGLARFCLSLHSEDANKISVLSRLEQTLDINNDDITETAYSSVIAEVQKLRGKLNDIINALHCKREFGCSLYQAIAILKKNIDYKNIIDFERSSFERIDHSHILQWHEYIREYKAAMREMGGTYDESLAGYNGTSYSMMLKEQLSQDINGLLKAVPFVEKAWEKICAWSEIPVETMTLEKMQEYLQVLDTIFVPENCLKDIVGDNNSVKVISEIKEFLTHLENYKKDEAGCAQYFDLRVLDLDVQSAKTAWDFATKMGDFDGTRNRLHNELQSYAKPGVVIKPEVMQFNYTYIGGIATKRNAILVLGNSIKAYLGGLYQGTDTDIVKVNKAIDDTLKFAADFDNVSDKLNISIKALEAAGPNSDIQKEKSKIEAFIKTIRNFAAEYNIDFYSTGTETVWPIKIRAVLECYLDNLSGLRSKVAYNVVAEKLRIAGLDAVVKAFEEGKLNRNNIDSAFAGGIYYHIVMLTVSADERLADFYGMKYNEMIDRYREVIARYQKACTDELVAKLCQRVVNILNDLRFAEEIGVLKKAIKGKGRNKPIRKLFNEISKLLPNISPCMLMNPISVAQYIDMGFPKFDLVIFDEASQIPTSEAVGAIARGKDAIVVGDPKQMPPTSFFATAVVTEDEDAEDMESLLVDCQTISMPVTELKWHYRSQHESLIAFSNVKYYGSNLYTFPTPNDLVSEVKIIHPEGYYDRKSGCNKAEAEAIVAEIVHRYRDPELKKDSIGVITFNVKQQSYIEDMLEKTLKLPENEDLIGVNIPKNVFIKNLENVQGDEADVILFSIGYGADKEGKITMNFGPLNRDGGWRRLNVAVSRSRKSMIIYSTLRPEQIRNDVTAEGVRNLKEFLSYAENRKALAGGRGIVNTEAAEYLVEEIAHSIEEMGYSVKCNIGNSEFKMDIGIVNPYNQDLYLMGILLDSENCKEAATARDRFVLQPSILRGLGWKLMRLWIMDWLDDSRKVKMYLQDAIEAEAEKAKAIFEAEQADKMQQAMKLAELAQAKDIVVAEVEPEEEAEVLNVQTVSEAITNETEKIVPEIQGNTSVNEAKEAKVEEVESKAEVTVSQNEEPAGDAETVQLESQNTNAKPKFSRRGPKEYKVVTLKPQGEGNDIYTDAAMAKMITVITKILAKEAPIARNSLRNKVIALWGFSKSGAKLDRTFSAALAQVSDNITDDNGTIFVWTKDQNPDLYNIYREAAGRGLDEIPSQELINTAYVALKDNGSMFRGDLQRDVAQRLSCARFTKTVEAIITNAVDKALADDVFRMLANGKVGISRK